MDRAGVRDIKELGGKFRVDRVLPDWLNRMLTRGRTRTLLLRVRE